MGPQAPSRSGRRVDGLPDDRVAEPEAPRGFGGPDEVDFDQFVECCECGGVIEFSGRAGDLEAERIAGHGRPFDQLACCGRQAPEFPLERACDRRRGFIDRGFELGIPLAEPGAGPTSA